MKKYLLLFLFPILALAVGSCKDDNDDERTPLLFSTESVSNAESIRIEYSTPDPGCVSKRYWIHADNTAGELTVKCINANSISIESNQYGISNTYICKDGHWTARVVNGNCIKFTFDEMFDYNFGDIYKPFGAFAVFAQTEEGELQNIFYAGRYLEPVRQ